MDVEKKELRNGRFGFPVLFAGVKWRGSRTDIRPVQEPRTKSYIHASSHYASLSRLGSAVRRERRRRKKERPSRREDATRPGERTTAYAVGLFGSFFLYMRGGEGSCVPDSRGIRRGSMEERGRRGNCILFTAMSSRRRKEKQGGIPRTKDFTFWLINGGRCFFDYRRRFLDSYLSQV